jgi:hypothetical protein
MRVIKSRTSRASFPKYSLLFFFDTIYKILDCIKELNTKCGFIIAESAQFCNFVISANFLLFIALDLLI